MNIRQYEILFDTTPGEQLREDWQSGVVRQRAKTIKAGELLYCESYPIWNTKAGREAAKKLKELKRMGTTEAQRKLNLRYAKRKLILKVNTNFGEHDLLCTMTYPPDGQPADAKTAQRDMKNYVRRLQTLCRRAGMPDRKYVIITEMTHSKKQGIRYHHHMILSGEGLQREDVEECWRKVHSGLCNTRRYQYQDTVLTGFATYLLKGIDGDGKQQIATRRRWSCSQNLKDPIVSVADKKISRRRVELIARDVEQFGREIFERLYPGYQFINAVVKTSSFVDGAYLYITMRRMKTKGRYQKMKRKNQIFIG